MYTSFAISTVIFPNYNALGQSATRPDNREINALAAKLHHDEAGKLDRQKYVIWNSLTIAIPYIVFGH